MFSGRGQATVSKSTESLMSIKNFVSAFINDEEGATLIEYGLIAALVSVAVITAATLLGTNLKATFT